MKTLWKVGKVKSFYDFYEYRVLTDKDYHNHLEAFKEAMGKGYHCYVRTWFLRGEKFGYTSIYMSDNISERTYFFDLYARKFKDEERVKHMNWASLAKCVPILRRIR